MSSAKPVTDHSEIRRWAETNNARPACLKGTGKGKDPGSLRLDSTTGGELEEISWDVWFDAFEKNKLALLMSPNGRFNKQSVGKMRVDRLPQVRQRVNFSYTQSLRSEYSRAARTCAMASSFSTGGRP